MAAIKGLENKTHKILLVDDDVAFCELLTEYLVSEGFSVKAVHDGTHALSAIEQNRPDIIILDVMLPGLSGTEVLKKIRTQFSLPVVMLTARGDDWSRIQGLEYGADDYIAKPCNPRELLARIRAILRRLAGYKLPVAAQMEEEIEVNHLSIKTAVHEVRQADHLIELTKTEYSILLYLIQHPNRVITKSELNVKIFGKMPRSYDRSLDMHISNLRLKLGTHKLPHFIKTVRGVGYIYEIKAGAISSEVELEPESEPEL